MQGKVGNGKLLTGHGSPGFLHHGGIGMWVWFLSGFVQVRGKREGEIKVKNSYSPAIRLGEEKEAQCHLKQHRVVVLFLKKNFELFFVFSFFFVQGLKN